MSRSSPGNPKQGLLAERLVADAVRGSDIPYDLISEDDLTEDRVQKILRTSLSLPVCGDDCDGGDGVSGVLRRQRA